MTIGWIEKIRRHAAVATGDFGRMFRDVKIPPLPAAAVRLVGEMNKPEPDPKQLVRILSGSPELAARVLQTVNSSYFSLGHRVTTLPHAISLLGMRQIRSIALSYTMVSGVPRPKDDGLFDHEAFWIDSLIRTLIARSLARRQGLHDEEEAFTAMLLADVALPVLLVAWREYYAPIVERWAESDERLSRIERENLRWDHAQAGAWILRSWGFPEEIVCFVGAHNLSAEELAEAELENTIALPMSVASLAPSVLRRNEERVSLFAAETRRRFGIDDDGFRGLIDETRTGLDEIRSLFGLGDRGVGETLDAIAAAGAADAGGTA
ncbi:MAG: HDOD domain-containing protein [Candidatus Eisenbacteria bacterium]|nr:HDOD domain-containing protein [Candidatus Eisenbacteria bacterium]